jgi:hypothetical protein
MSAARRTTFSLGCVLSVDSSLETAAEPNQSLARLLPRWRRELAAMPNARSIAGGDFRRPDARLISRAPEFQFDLALGRLLAACAHPLAAWRIAPRWKRLAILIVYFGTAYVGVLIALWSASMLR